MISVPSVNRLGRHCYEQSSFRPKRQPLGQELLRVHRGVASRCRLTTTRLSQTSTAWANISTCRNAPASSLRCGPKCQPLGQAFLPSTLSLAGEGIVVSQTSTARASISTVPNVNRLGKHFYCPKRQPPGQAFLRGGSVNVPSVNRSGRSCHTTPRTAASDRHGAVPKRQPLGQVFRYVGRLLWQFQASTARASIVTSSP
jgi:hypothetical protein